MRTWTRAGCSIAGATTAIPSILRAAGPKWLEQGAPPAKFSAAYAVSQGPHGLEILIIRGNQSFPSGCATAREVIDETPRFRHRAPRQHAACDTRGSDTAAAVAWVPERGLGRCVRPFYRRVSLSIERCRLYGGPQPGNRVPLGGGSL